MCVYNYICNYILVLKLLSHAVDSSQGSANIFYKGLNSNMLGFAGHISLS